MSNRRFFRDPEFPTNLVLLADERMALSEAAGALEGELFYDASAAPGAIKAAPGGGLCMLVASDGCDQDAIEAALDATGFSQVTAGEV